jgi:hypothetical protein
VNRENLSLGLLIWKWELDLSVDTTRSDQSWVKTLDPVGCHDNLNIATSVKAIQLVEKLKHSPLNFFFTAGRRVIPFAANSVNFINEDNCWCHFFSTTEDFSNKLWTLTSILLD